MTLAPLPAKCLELNAMVNAWRFMRDNWLSSGVFQDHDDIAAHCCPPLELADRAAMAHHVHRNAALGASVLVRGIWYKRPHPTLRHIWHNQLAIPLPKRAAHH